MPQLGCCWIGTIIVAITGKHKGRHSTVRRQQGLGPGQGGGKSAKPLGGPSAVGRREAVHRRQKQAEATGSFDKILQGGKEFGALIVRPGAGQGPGVERDGETLETPVSAADNFLFVVRVVVLLFMEADNMGQGLLEKVHGPGLVAFLFNEEHHADRHFQQGQEMAALDEKGVQAAEGGPETAQALGAQAPVWAEDLGPELVKGGGYGGERGR